MSAARPDERSNPLWVLLGVGSGARLWFPPDNAEDWEPDLRHAVEGVDGGQPLILSLPRPAAQRLLALLTRRKAGRPAGPGPADVRRTLQDLGMRVEASYTLWPSPRSPRVAFPSSSRRMLLWLQRSGVIGGGGRRLWARLLARSWVFTPLALLLGPGQALVARRTTSDRPA